MLQQDTHDRIEDINASFKDAWEKNGGREQTKFFMSLILRGIPEDVRLHLKNNCPDIADVGCALGDGCHLLGQQFPQAKIHGLDPSSVAIYKAIEQYGSHRNLNFEVFALSAAHVSRPGKRYDTVICSNVLEHFSDPIPYFWQLLGMAGKYAIILVPYDEENRIPGHRVTITESTFPKAANGLKRIMMKVIDTGNNPYWSGPQILFVYERQK